VAAVGGEVVVEAAPKATATVDSGDGKLPGRERRVARTGFTRSGRARSGFTRSGRARSGRARSGRADARTATSAFFGELKIMKSVIGYLSAYKYDEIRRTPCMMHKN
jgi:hypothetical protein